MLNCERKQLVEMLELLHDIVTRTRGDRKTLQMMIKDGDLEKRGTVWLARWFRDSLEYFMLFDHNAIHKECLQ